MSKVTIQGDASGTGIFTIASPNSNTDRTLVLPDEAGTPYAPALSGFSVATTLSGWTPSRHNQQKLKSQPKLLAYKLSTTTTSTSANVPKPTHQSLTS
jgi:hypothetical protein